MMANRRAQALKIRRRNRNRLVARFEPLEGRALLSTLFVNRSNQTGIEDGTSTHPFTHIQAAINKSAAGDTVAVAAGTYAESLVINHALNLVGPNAGINPNTGTRVAEAVVIPAASNPNSGRMILVTGNGVTIDGLTLDGHNGSLATGTLLNGVSSNAASGITNIDSSGKVAVISHLVVQNDIIKNLTAFGVMADVNDFSTSTLAVSTGNLIHANLIDNLPVVSPVPGRGISIEDNFYADVTDNVITRAGTGIQAIFMLNPNPASTVSTISGNIVHDYALGIYLWTMDSDAPAFNVVNNTIATENDPQTIPSNAGIELDHILGTSAVSLSGNSVSGAHAGVLLQYTPVSPTVTVAGGTLAGNDYGVLINNRNTSTGTSSPSAVQANLAGVTITGSKLAALDVVDGQTAAGRAVNLNVDAATTLSGNAHGAVLSGPNAHLVEAVKPVVSLTSTPASSTSDTSASFGFTATDNITTTNDLVVKYSLDGGPATTATSPVNLSGLALGSHSFALTATDQAGNATATTYSWTVSTGPPPPPAPSTPVLDPASDTGSSSSDGITSDRTPTFTGTAPAGSTVTVLAGSSVLGTTTAGSGGNWSFTVGGLGLADGSYSITATDNNGTATSGASGRLALVVDTAAPSFALTSTPPAQTTSNVGTFAFTASDNGPVPGSVDTRISTDGGTPVQATSPVTVTLNPLAYGSHTVQFYATDQAGNVTTTSYTWTLAAGATTWYVAPTNGTGVEDGSTTHPFTHIQAAINASHAGDTVAVAAGTYAESLVINHALNLVGPNAGVNPNTGTRAAEAVLVPDVNNAYSGRMILVTGNGVTIDGLTLDGHNGSLATGTLLNGVSSNAASGITNIDSSGKVAVISHLVVQNDIIKNLTAFGVMADVNDFSTSTLAVSTGNLIHANLIDNLPVVSPVPGRGISIEDNFYADVTDNVITRAGTGIQAIFMLNPNPASTVSTISGNIVHDYALGIYLWTMDSDAPAFNVVNNTIATENDPQTIPSNAGIELDRILHTSAVSLSGNSVSGAHAGVLLQYTPVSPTVTVAGGTLAGNDYGVLITNSDVPSGDVPPKAVQANLAGVTITGSKLAALDVVDALASGATVTLNVDAATTLSGNAHGAVLSGPNAHLVEAVKPVVSLTSMPASSTSDTSASFGFTATDNITTTNDLVVKYSLDGGPATTATSPVNLSGLAVGGHTFVLMATDQVGNSGTVTYQWTINTVTTPSPNAPSTPTLTAVSDAGLSSVDGVTNVNTPAFVGTAPLGSTVTLRAGTTVLGTTTADPSTGQWSFTVGGAGAIPTSLADGTYAITATDQVGSGNSSQSSAALTITIDTVRPTVSLTSTPPAATTSTSAAFSFTAADNVSSGSALLIEYATDASVFQTASNPLALSNLSVGSHTIVVRAEDRAGNTSSAQFTWTVNAPSVPPPPPSTPALDPASDTGSSASDGITQDRTPTFTGTAPAGNTVSLYDGSTLLGTTTASAGGGWTFTVGGTGLADGSHTISATDQDVPGNSSSPSGAVTLVVDTALPVVSLTTTPPAQTTSTSASFSFTAGDNLTAAGGLVTTYSLDGGAPVAATSPVNLSGLALGSHSFVLISTDQAGNAASASYQWTVATVPPPGTPSTPILDAASDTGLSNNDGITLDNTPTFTGTAPAGSTVSLFAGTTLLGTTTADANGQWTFTLSGAGLGDGSYAVTATAQSGGLTSQASGTCSIVIDTTPPAIQAARSPQPNSAGWNNTNVVASYTASDALSGLVSPQFGSFTFTAQGAGQSQCFTVTDLAGNTASATVGPVQIDKSAPSISIAATPNRLQTSSSGQASVTISGRITDSLSGPGSSLTYTIKDSYKLASGQGTVTVGAGGAYSFPLTLSTVLNGKNATRTYTITVTSQDAAGNSRTVSTTVSVRSGSVVIQSQSQSSVHGHTQPPKVKVKVKPKVTHATPRPPAHPKRWH